MILPNPFYKRAFDFRCGFGREEGKEGDKEAREMNNTIYSHDKFLLEILNPEIA